MGLLCVAVCFVDNYAPPEILAPVINYRCIVVHRQVILKVAVVTLYVVESIKCDYHPNGRTKMISLIHP
jgi:hypothetical protein